MSNRKVQYLLLFLVFFIATVLRLAFLDADPSPEFARSLFINGGYIHNAINKALFGQWIMDDMNFLYAAPIFNFTNWLILNLLGVGFLEARLLNAVVGVATSVVLYFFLKQPLGEKSALLAALFYGICWLAVGYDRDINIDPVVALFLLVGIMLSVRAITRSGSGGWRYIIWFAAGVMFAAAFFVKSHAVFIVPVVLYLFYIRLRQGPGWLGSTSALLFGIILMSIPFFVWLIIPNIDSYMNFMLMSTKGTAYGLNFVALIYQIPNVLVNNIFFSGRMMLPGLVIGYLLLEMIRVESWKDVWKRQPLEARLMWLWLASAFVFFGIFSTEQFTRRFVNYLPAIAVLAAVFIREASSSPSLANFNAFLADAYRVRFLRLWGIVYLAMLSIQPEVVLAARLAVARLGIDGLLFLPLTYKINSWGYGVVGGFLTVVFVSLGLAVLLRRLPPGSASMQMVVRFTGWMAAAWLIGPLVRRLADFIAPYPYNRIAMIFYVLVALLLSVLSSLTISRRSNSSLWRLSYIQPNVIWGRSRYVISLFIIFSLSFQWQLLAPSFAIRDASRDLARFINPGETIMGNISTTISLENHARSIDPRALHHRAMYQMYPDAREYYETSINAHPFDRFKPEYLVVWGNSMKKTPPGPDWELQWYLDEARTAGISLTRLKRYELWPRGWAVPYLFDFYRLSYPQ